MKRISLIILLVCLIASISYAESICLNEDDAARAIVEIETGRDCKEILVIQEQVIDEKDFQIAAYSGALKSCMTQVQNDGKTIDDLNSVIKDQKTIYNELIEAATPSFADRVKIFVNDALLTIVIIGGVLLFVAN